MKEFGVFDFGLGDFLYCDKQFANGAREVPPEEQKDISFLITEEYVSYFTDESSCFDGAPLCGEPYPEIMERFSDDVARAHRALYRFGYYYEMGIEYKMVWAEMREKYFNGEPYVQPEDMILFLKAFDNRECIAFLYYCVIYKERYCIGVFGEYAKEGLIGKVLLRLKELPQFLYFEEDII